MKTFKFKFYTRTPQGQEFIVGSCTIKAKNCDEANKILSQKDLPFHHFATIEKIN